MYDTLPSSRVPDWIAETVDTRNEVTLKGNVREKSLTLIRTKCKLYRGDVDEFWAGVVQTLEADVRSKFQTKKAIIDSDKGVIRLLPFDEVVVRFVLLLPVPPSFPPSLL
jgi:hypothetical protein